jgi:acyl-CoA synthetase (AMP-forming)/AMP-acid ligase II
MNIFDFLFEHTSTLEKDLLMGSGGNKSFKSIFEASLKVAGYLETRIGKHQKVLLLAPNGEFFIVAYLGILKSGNICVPLNPGIEPETLEFIRQKTDSKTGFLSETVRKRVQPNLECITEEQVHEIVSKDFPVQTAAPEFDEEQLAEIIFTSGSTALPKGVMLSHHNIIANTESILEYLDINQTDTMMVVLPFFYCYGLSLLHTHIRIGASLAINNNFIFLGSTINDLNKYGCTSFAGVPSHFQILLRKSDQFKKTRFPALRYVTQAGGKLYNTFISEFTAAFPEVQFFVMYGQTEATARLSYLPPQMLSEKMGSLGKGIPGVELMVADEQGRPVKPGKTGEILACGKNIMLGYFKEPEMTEATIRDGWLHTGDLATIDNDGYIYLTARKKEIIKVGGNRVSPKEIEEVIVMMSGIVDCTVEAVEDELLGEAIKATVVVNEIGKSITCEELKKYCGSKLSGYKVPTHIEFKESMTISPSGKKIR